jgi:hypothetical protein
MRIFSIQSQIKSIPAILFLLTLSLFSCGQKYKYPGELQIRGYSIGQQVDTSLFKKHSDVYFPNYLDGWTMNNFDKLPKKYRGLPIAVWQLRSDSSIALTLLDNTILNITLSYMHEDEKEKFSNLFTEKFGADGKEKSYEERHPLQAWITYWNLKTWENSEAVAQIGNSDMRKPEDPAPAEIRWNLAYSDFILEKKIVDEFRKNKK